MYKCLVLKYPETKLKKRKFFYADAHIDSSLNASSNFQNVNS